MKAEELMNFVEWMAMRKTKHRKGEIAFMMTRCPLSIDDVADVFGDKPNLSDDMSRAAFMRVWAGLAADWAIAMLDEAQER